MVIWIDITNAPHPLFFKDFIKEWESKNYEIIVTTRPLSNTIELLKNHQIKYTIVGSHYKNKILKVFGFFKRCKELHDFLKSKKINISISQSSYYSPFVSFRLNIPSIYTNDNEFAKGNYVAFLFSQYILLPEALKIWVSGRFFEKKITFYPGVKEAIYTKKILKNSNKKNTIYFRPEPWYAQYHDFKKTTFDKILLELSFEKKIVILPRGSIQTQYFSNLFSKNSNIVVSLEAQSVSNIVENCSLFLGSGGSMTREFAIMGIPTISLYQGELLEVDKYLIKHNLLVSIKNLSKIDLIYIDRLIKKVNLSSYSNNAILKKGLKTRNIIHKIIDSEKVKLELNDKNNAS